MTTEEREAIRQIFREEIRAALNQNQEYNLDADYLASLPPAQRKLKLIERRRKA